MIKSRLRPDIFYPSHTKVLCIFSIEPPDLLALFPALSSIESLAILNPRSLGVKEINALAFSGPRPSKLSGHWHWAVDPPESHPAKSFPLPLLFQNVTHLELEIVHQSFDGKQFHSLKHLTHLSLVQLFPAISASWFPALLQRLDFPIPLQLASSFLVGLPRRRFVVSRPSCRLCDLSRPIPHGKRFEHVLRRQVTDEEDHFIRQWGKHLDTQEMDVGRNRADSQNATSEAFCMTIALDDILLRSSFIHANLRTHHPVCKMKSFSSYSVSQPNNSARCHEKA
ncbi:hypothetical protein C8J56DRAFT_1054519 [Mycena floridula]|nr:hypothetical protein C8J56DRAFT_1054519 [Mycena floridula]